MAAEYGLKDLSIVSQGGFGLAESIDRDWSFYVDTATRIRPDYKGPSLQHKNDPIRAELMQVYHFDTTNNKLLCEYDGQGRCTDVQINDPGNYVRYHLVSLLEKMRAEKYTRPLNTLILGCTHYPLMESVFQDALGPDVKVFSQANLVAESLADYLTRRPEMIGAGTDTVYLTTGSPARVSDRATQFLRRQIRFDAA